MISELFLYGSRTGLFKSITGQIDAIKTYHVSPDYGKSLDTDNLNEYLKDPKYGLTGPEFKYPICVCVSPKSRPTDLYGYRWEQFFFSLYFLQRTYVENKNKIKLADKDNNLSTHLIEEDWAEMKDAAMNFIDILTSTLKGSIVIDEETLRFKQVLNLDRDKMDVSRLSKFNDDNVSGIRLSFNAFLNTSICEITDGDIVYIISSLLPEEDPIWNAEKVNYYTKEEIDGFTKILGSGTSFTILYSEHMKAVPKGVTLLKPITREEVSVFYEINDDQSVYIQSDTDLLDYKLIIY